MMPDPENSSAFVDLFRYLMVAAAIVIILLLIIAPV